jgi:hypothetical protein
MKSSVKKLLKNNIEAFLLTHAIPELFNKNAPYLRSRVI